MTAPCAGIIVFDNDKTILVSTQNGNFSFPKGKRNKGETSIDTAWREFNEETGMNGENIKLIDDIPIDENSDKGNLNIRYYVGHLVKHSTLKCDPEELDSVAWYSIADALKFDKFKKTRKDILMKAYEKYKNYLN